MNRRAFLRVAWMTPPAAVQAAPLAAWVVKDLAHEVWWRVRLARHLVHCGVAGVPAVRVYVNWAACRRDVVLGWLRTGRSP